MEIISRVSEHSVKTFKKICNGICWVIAIVVGLVWFFGGDDTANSATTTTKQESNVVAGSVKIETKNNLDFTDDEISYIFGATCTVDDIGYGQLYDPVNLRSAEFNTRTVVSGYVDDKKYLVGDLRNKPWYDDRIDNIQILVINYDDYPIYILTYQANKAKIGDYVEVYGVTLGADSWNVENKRTPVYMAGSYVVVE